MARKLSRIYLYFRKKKIQINKFKINIKNVVFIQGTHQQKHPQHLHQSQAPKQHYHHHGGGGGSADSISSNDSNSINSSNRNFSFWKSSPEEETAWCTRQRLRSAWKYAQWPLALLLASIISIALVYFLATQSMNLSADVSDETPPTSLATISDNRISDTFNDFNDVQPKLAAAPTLVKNGKGYSGWSQQHSHDGDDAEDLHRRLTYKTLQFEQNKQLQKQSFTSSLDGFSADVFATNEFVSRTTTDTSAPYTESMNFRSTRPLTSQAKSSTEDYKNDDAVAIVAEEGETPSNPFSRYEEFSLEEEVRSVEQRKFEGEKATEKPKSPKLTIADIGRTIKSTLMFPSEETLKFFGFTSGHQNNFGVPIEEDERMLRLLNEQLRLAAEKEPNNSDGSVNVRSTTDSNVHQTRVSPTLPFVQRGAADRTSSTTQRTVDDDSEGKPQQS